ncbi:MAG: NADP-dependent oxidoreductase [Gaiellaceae bacterium]
MKAVTYSRFGGPDVLELSEREPLPPAAGEVRLKVRAASVNPIDIKIRRGMMPGIPVRFPITPGLDVAGTVEIVGDGVNDVEAGDEVLGVASSGAYAERALARVWTTKPERVSWELAACLPTVGEAAFRALKHLGVGAGQTLLIHGAAGSVGAIATQLATSRGVTVIGSVSDTDAERVSSVGAIPVRYGEGLVERVREVAPDAVDAVLDTAGQGVLGDSIELAGGPDHVITLADPDARAYGVRFTGADPTDRAWEALARLAEFAAADALELPIWCTYPLAEAAHAHADIEEGRNHGKIVLIP